MTNKDPFDDLPDTWLPTKSKPVATPEPPGESSDYLPPHLLEMPDYNSLPRAVSRDALEKEIESEINRKVLQEEMSLYETCLDNMCKAVTYANTVRGVLDITSMCLTISKQRRASVEHAIKLKLTEKPTSEEDTWEIDSMGNLVRKR